MVLLVYGFNEIDIYVVLLEGVYEYEFVVYCLCFKYVVDVCNLIGY